MDIVYTSKNTTDSIPSIFRLANILWFASTCFGLALFATYVILQLSQPYSGEQPPSLTLHLIFAVLVITAGPVQLIPMIRRHWPHVHRWNGLIYTVLMIAATVSGLYLLFREDIGSWTLKAGFVAQTAFIIAFAGFTILAAISRDLVTHERWALRFFVVANIAFYYRIILVVWVMQTGGLGINMETGEGWFLDMMAVTQFFPLLLLEAYFFAQRTSLVKVKRCVQIGLYITSLVIFIGSVLLSVGMWFPALFNT